MSVPLKSLSALWAFYAEGFRSMTTGRVLWTIILIKLFIIFVVLRVFFFQPAMAGMTEEEKTHAVAGAVVAPSDHP